MDDLLDHNIGNQIYGSYTKKLSGSDRLRLSICDLSLYLSPTSSFQVNPWMAESLYRRIEQLIGSPTRVGTCAWALYCGIGHIALIMARAGYRVLGVEENSDSIEDAHHNAKANGFSREKVSFIDRSIEVKNPPAIVVSPSTTLIGEGGTTSTLKVSLSIMPSSPVRVNFSKDSQLTTSETSLTFDESNWSTPQEITVTAVDDGAFEKSHTGILQIEVDSGSDELYKVLNKETINFTIQDNDAVNFGAISGRLWNDRDSNQIVDEGEQPLSGWTVFIDSNNNGQLDLGETSTTTNRAGWYLFEGLTPGAYNVGVKSNTGWSPTFPASQDITTTSQTNMIVLSTVYYGLMYWISVILGTARQARSSVLLANKLPARNFL